MARVVALELPDDGASAFEPYVDVDGSNPDRISVAAQYGIRGGRAARHLQLWTTDDGGDSWFTRRVPNPMYDGGFTADPLTAFTDDGAILVVGDCMPGTMAETNEASGGFTRESMPPFEELLSGWAEALEWPDKPLLAAELGGIGISRSEDGGRTLTGTTVHGVSGEADRAAIAVDRFEGSPHRGNVYVSWSDFSRGLHVARSTDGGRSFDPPVVFSPWGCTHGAQLAVRPDGSVHLVYFLMSLAGIPRQIPPYIPRPGAPADATRAVYHAVSTDGGATFAEPAVVAHHGGPGIVGLPTLACDDDGRLLMVWTEVAEQPDRTVRPILQARHRLFGTHSDVGTSWSVPAELAPSLPAGSHIALPAVAPGFWIVAYLADDARTQVVLLRSADGTVFEIDDVLATRPIPVDGIDLFGSVEFRYVDDIPHVGDYISVASGGGRVAAAFALPESDDPMSTSRIYACLKEEA